MTRTMRLSSSSQASKRGETAAGRRSSAAGAGGFAPGASGHAVQVRRSVRRGRAAAEHAAQNDQARRATVSWRLLGGVRAAHPHHGGGMIEAGRQRRRGSGGVARLRCQVAGRADRPAVAAGETGSDPAHAARLTSNGPPVMRGGRGISSWTRPGRRRTPSRTSIRACPAFTRLRPALTRPAPRWA